MDATMQRTTKIEHISEEINFTALLNCFLREYKNWHRFFYMPKYDQTLRDYFLKVNHDKWIKILFPESRNEVYCPLTYYSATGRHLYKFPIIERNTETDVISEISIASFLSLIANELGNSSHQNLLLERINDSITNTAIFLEEALHDNILGELNNLSIPFIKAEQSMLLGHQLHPVSKSRMGFSRKELGLYTPEMRNSFQLHYFLADPELVVEKSTYTIDITQKIRTSLIDDPRTSPKTKGFINLHNDKKLLPIHPWEALHLLKQADVIKLIEAGKLIYVGPFGPEYTATSSVRTVYNAYSEFMFKFSLHVKITNSERVNLERELYRGYDISRLMHTTWGEQLKDDFPEIIFVTDPGFIAVKNLDGNFIEGFNTVIRKNIFQKGDGAEKNVTPIAALTQDGLLGQGSRLSVIIKSEALRTKRSTEDLAKEWLKKYLRISLVPLIRIYNRFGLACEAHQQNIMVELDSIGFPKQLYFRDNQGYFFREGKAEELHFLLPDLGETSQSIIPEEYIHPKYTYYLLINNIFGIIGAFGSNGLANEEHLIKILIKELEALQIEDTTGLVEYLLYTRDWTAKGNLLTTLGNKDEARAPIENPAEYVDYPNPLVFRYFSKNIIKPDINSLSFKKDFPDLGIEITLRPFDLSRDLEMVHDWFNQEHTKAFWKMDGPIRDLEAFYIMLKDADHSNGFIGMINGEPTFTLEPYWPMRDTVGKYYESLPGDYGAHLLIAPTDKNKKFTMPVGQVTMEFIFSQPEVGKCIGEADINAKPMHILVTRLGFKLQKVIAMPHKTSNLTFCTREWYKERFPNCDINVHSSIPLNQENE
ncbi:GNAT family N-acetyltransferase [Sporocytophaga myxococcoides]|uniref:GNAT family N-acetyltransferase n=1 Tax=Sporocytophaga myxococcoides TaxID=153721 RepID=UPI000400FF0A|nr:GNAT family N-acetyltransferase [Sporocytophaga myxococcoides]